MKPEPCPYCACDPEIMRSGDHSHVYCPNVECLATGPRTDHGVEQWNYMCRRLLAPEPVGMSDGELQARIALLALPAESQQSIEEGMSGGAEWWGKLELSVVDEIDRRDEARK